MVITDVERWPHQIAGHEQTLERLDAGVKALCVTSPTGGGKGLMMADLGQACSNVGKRVLYYVNRKLLIENLMKRFDEYGLDYSVLAAEWDGWYDPGKPIQICSIQTVNARYLNRKDNLGGDDPLPVPNADVIVRDEAHLRDYDAVLHQHLDDGCQLVGYTATPLGISDLYDELLIAGTKRELFAYDPPALIPTHVSSIEEPDLKKVGRRADGEFIINGKIRRRYTAQIVGSVIGEWQKRAYDRPTICFAYGVPESLFHCKEFNRYGVPAAHIDGNDVYVDGEFHKSDPNARADVFSRFEDGDIKILCNRFVLREGVDLPFVSYLILACPIGSLLSYIQVVGRLLRYHPSIEEHRIQDHGGNWWRHPSPNSDVDWNAAWGLDCKTLSAARQLQIQQGDLNPGITCPACREVMKPNKRGECPLCGTEIERGRPIRRIIEEDGAMKTVEGFPARKTRLVDGTQKLWEGIFWSHRKHKKDRSFGQAWAWFCKRHWDKFRCQPPRNLPYMPKDYLDWYKPVADVPFDRLMEKPIENPK